MTDLIAIDAQQFAVVGLDPISTPSEWDYIVLAGCISPGLAEVSDCDIDYEWDEPKAKGSSGSDSVYQGRKPTVFKVTLKLWAPAHFKTWEIFRQLLVLPEGGTTSSGGAAPVTSNDLGPRFDQTATTGTTTTATATTTRTEPVALDIEHPWCAMQGIHSVVPGKVGQPRHDGNGLYTIEITLREHKKPRAAGGKPTGSVAQAAPGKFGGAGAGGGSGPVDASGGDPNEWATVPNPDGEDYRKVEEPTAVGEAEDGEAEAIAEDP